MKERTTKVLVAAVLALVVLGGVTLALAWRKQLGPASDRS